MGMGKSLVSLVKILSSYKALWFTKQIPGDNCESKELMNTMTRRFCKRVSQDPTGLMTSVLNRSKHKEMQDLSGASIFIDQMWCTRALSSDA